MAKRKDTARTGWTKTVVQRTEVARAAGGREDGRRPIDANVRRMGPYETSYQVDFGYVTQRETLL